MHNHAATGNDLTLGLIPPGLAHVPVTSPASALVTTDHGFVGPWQNSVLDVSRPVETTPRWRRVGIWSLQAIVLAELAGAAIVVLGLPLALAARGIVELVAWLGRSVVP